MLCTIKTGRTSVKINRLGAELKSMNIGGEEFIWNSDPQIWASSAPVLFPFVGRLINKEYIYAEQAYKMPIHGFARKRFFDIESCGDSFVKMTLKDDEETILMFPFNFKLEVAFALVNERKLRVDYTVLNCGLSNMYFSIGSHPGLSLPQNKCEIYDYYIEFDTYETLASYKLVNDEYLVRNNKLYLNNEKIIMLTKDIFNEDAIILTGLKSRNIYLKNDKIGRILKVDIDNAPDLGIWAKPAAPYVCIEPWFGHDDPKNVSGRIEEKPGIIKLESGKEFKTGYSLDVIQM